MSKRKQQEIVQLPLMELIEKLQTDNLKAAQVLEAYQIEARMDYILFEGGRSSKSF